MNEVGNRMENYVLFEQPMASSMDVTTKIYQEWRNVIDEFEIDSFLISEDCPPSCSKIVSILTAMSHLEASNNV